MKAAMHHRGPDDRGHLSVDSVSLGMTRLAIFDPANGHQPISTSDGRYSLVFNGAIYNHRELRAELTSLGAHFQTHCDTEVLLHAWATWREGCLGRLRGMFAFAIWDNRTKCLHLARDPLGIKPLYLSEQNGNLLFASELNALRASGHFDDEIDPASIDAFLRNLAVPAPQTIYRHARILNPGERAEWHEGVLKIERYWKIPAPAQKQQLTSEEFTQQLRAQLEDSISMHRVADVPVGAFLSGGLDSAVIVGLMAQQSSRPLKTFSIGFEEAAYSEAAVAAETAKHFHTDHHPVTLSGIQAAEKIPAFIDALDQPTGDGFNTFVVSESAKSGGVTAALSGLGGDELFGGYPQFLQTPRISEVLPMWRVLPTAIRNSICRRLAHGSTRSRRIADVLLHARDLHDAADRQRMVLSDDARAELLVNPARASTHPAHQHLRSITGHATAQEIISAWELSTYMSDVLLRDSDIFSMRASLELRVPFVDRVLVEWLGQQSSHLRYDPKLPKGAVVTAVKDILPPNLLTRKKRGFTLPFPQWMRGPLKPFIEDTLTADSIQQTPHLNAAKVQQRWQQFRDGGDDKDWSRVWSIVVLTAFLNRSHS